MEDKVTPELLSITDVGAATGLKSSALRYYEQAGLIESTARVGGRRHYEPSVLQRLAIVLLLQEVGFTIGEIAELVDRSGKGVGWRSLANAKLQEIDTHLERVFAARELLTAVLECGCTGIESCDFIQQRRDRHRKAVQTLTLQMGPPTP